MPDKTSFLYIRHHLLNNGESIDYIEGVPNTHIVIPGFIEGENRKRREGEHDANQAKDRMEVTTGHFGVEGFNWGGRVSREPTKEGQSLSCFISLRRRANVGKIEERFASLQVQNKDCPNRHAESALQNGLSRTSQLPLDGRPQGFKQFRDG